MQTSRLSNPISQGRTIALIRQDDAAADTWECFFNIESDTVLLSLFVETLGSGTVDCIAFTQTQDAPPREVSVIEFPTLSGPTTELLLRKAPVTLSTIRVVLTCTGIATFELRARAISIGETSVRIEAARNWTVSKTSATSVAANLIPAVLDDRSGLLIKNYQGGGTLFLAESLMKLAADEGYPIGPGESLGMDLAAGQEVFGQTSGPALDIRIAEAGG